MIIGTAHFLSLAHAIRYYRKQGYNRDAAVTAVHYKLETGEIHIGEPEVPDGHKLVLLDDGARYGLDDGR